MKKVVATKAKAVKTVKEHKYYFGIFEVTAKDADALYVCGDSLNLGEWNAAKSVKMHDLGEGRFIRRKRFAIGQVVEFKFLRSPDWKDVEKGSAGEEIANRCIVTYEDKYVKANITNWRND